MKTILKSAMLALLCVGSLSCSKENTGGTDPVKTDGNYMLWLQVGSWPNTRQYVVGVDDITTGSVSLAGNGREVTGQADYGIIPHKGYYYMVNEELGAFLQYELKNNSWNTVKKVPYVHVNFGSATYTWVDDDTLLIAGPNGDNTEILYSIINIKTFKIVNGKLDLPTKPAGYSTYSIGNLEYTKGKVYFGFNFGKAWPNPSFDYALVGVADYTAAGLTMVATDENKTTAGNGTSRLWTTSSTVDDNGDVYMMTTPQMVNRTEPAKVMRFKSGAISLDDSYDFDVTAAIGSDGIQGLWNIGQGKAIVKYKNNSIPTTNAHAYEFAVIDLHAKTLVKKLTDLPRDNSDYVQSIIVDKGKIHVLINGESTNDYVWEINASDYSVKKGIQVVGDFDYLLRLDVL